MRKNILNILLHIGAAIILVFILYKFGGMMDVHSSETAGIDESDSTNRNGFDEIWIDLSEIVQNQEKCVESGTASEDFVELKGKPFCEFEEIEEKHEILEYDIGTSPQYDYENTLLQEYIENEKGENEEFVNTFGSRYEIWVDYHLFDFNDDGIEDYLLCLDGILYSGTGGHIVEIFIVKEDGRIEKVLSINLRFCHYKSSEHERFTVLNEKTDGYYAIVLPGSNRILRYDKQEGRYIFHEGE